MGSEMCIRDSVNTVWYAACPVGHNTLENLFRDMTSRAGIDPPMTNHCIRATSITVLSAANVERCHIKAITGHRSETSIQSYCDKPTFQQFKVMSNTLSDFIEDRDTDGYGIRWKSTSHSRNGSRWHISPLQFYLQCKHAWLKQRLNACSYILFCTS